MDFLAIRLRLMKLQNHTAKKQKLFQQIVMKREQLVKCKNLYILLAFLLIIIALLIAVSIYCYLIKYRAKQKHYHFTTKRTNQGKSYINKCIIKMRNSQRYRHKKPNILLF